MSTPTERCCWRRCASAIAPARTSPAWTCIITSHGLSVQHRRRRARARDPGVHPPRALMLASGAGRGRGSSRDPQPSFWGAHTCPSRSNMRRSLSFPPLALFCLSVLSPTSRDSKACGVSGGTNEVNVLMGFAFCPFHRRSELTEMGQPVRSWCAGGERHRSTTKSVWPISQREHMQPPTRQRRGAEFRAHFQMMRLCI